MFTWSWSQNDTLINERLDYVYMELYNSFNLKYRFLIEIPVGLANFNVFVDRKFIFELPFGLGNPNVLIHRFLYLSYRWVLETPIFSLIKSLYLNFLWSCKTQCSHC